MKAARLNVASRHFEIQDVPIPIPGTNEVLIQVKAAGVCSSDIHMLEGAITPKYLRSDSVTMGHEVAGVISQVGSEVYGWKVSDRVVVCAGIRDQYNRVTTLGFDYDGGFAEYLVVHQSTLISLPPKIPFDQGCIIPDAVSTPWAAIKSTARITSGESAVVFGIGGLGAHAIQLLKILGASPVVAVDPLAEARERAIQLGADAALDPNSEDFLAEATKIVGKAGFRAAFDFVGSNIARTQALNILGEQARLVIIGLNNSAINIPNDIVFAYKQLQLLGHYGSNPEHTEELVNMVANGVLDLSQSISAVIPLANAAAALHQLKIKEGNPIRIVLRP